MNQNITKEYKYLTVKEAAEKLKEKPNTIHQRIQRHTYKHIYKKNGKWYIREDELQNHVVENAENIQERIVKSINQDIKMVTIREYTFQKKKSRQLIFHLIPNMYSPIKIDGIWYIDINEPLWDKRVHIEDKYISMLRKKYNHIQIINEQK